MASLVSVGDNIYEAVSIAAKEEEKSYDEAVKGFLEVFEELILDRKKVLCDWAAANMPKTAEYFEKSYGQDVDVYLNAKEKYKTEPIKLLDWIAANAGIHAEDKKNLDLQLLK